MRRGITLGLALVASCSSGADLFVESPPAVNSAQTVVVFVADDSGTSATVMAAQGGAWEFPVSRWRGAAPDTLVLTVAAFTGSAPDLGLSFGALPAASSPRACALGEPVQVHRTTLTRGEPAPWDELSAMPQPMRDYVVGSGACIRENLCTRFSASVFDLPGSKDIFNLVAVDDRSVLVGDIERVYWRSYEDGRVFEVSELRGMPARGSTRGPDGTLWLVGLEGQLAHGRLGEGFVRESVGEDLALIDVDVDADGRVLVLGVRTSSVSSEQCVLLLREGTRWRRLGELDVPDASLSKSRVAWVGGGEALATYGGESLMYYDGAELKERIVGLSGPLFDLEINSVARHPTLSALMVGSDGRLYSGDSPYDTWLAFDGALLPVQAYEVVAYGAGAVFGGLDGTVSQHVPGSAPCPSGLIVGSNADRMVRVGDRVVVAGEPQERGFDNNVTWLVPID